MFRTIKKILDYSLETLAMVVVVLLVVDVLLQILVRFAPEILEITPLPEKLKLILRTGTEELAIVMLIWVALLGAAVALGRGSHLGIDYFVGKLPVRIRLVTEIFVFLCVAVFSFCVMILGGIDLVTTTLQLNQLSPVLGGLLGIEYGYVYLVVPISGFFLVLYSVIGLVERATKLIKGEPDLPQEAKEIESGIT